MVVTMDKIQNYFIELLGNEGFKFLMKILSIIIPVLIYILLYKVVKKLINNFFSKTRNNLTKYKLDEKRLVTLNVVSLSLLKYTFYFFIGASIVSFFGGSMQSIITVAGVGGIAIGFGAQSLVKDIISGFFILLENQISVGDIVKLSDITGTVEEIGIRTTKLRNFNGDLNIIPNGQITIVTNMTRDFKRAIVEIGINYEDNIKNIINILEDEMQKVFDEVHGLHEIPKVQGITAFEDSAVILRIAAECNINEVYAIEREIRKYVKIRFDYEGISMPYPHRIIEIKELNK